MRCTTGIDIFCSSSPWIISHKRAFHPQKPTIIHRFDGGFSVFRRQRLGSHGLVFLPLEDSWCFASPIVGDRPDQVVHELSRYLYLDEPHWDTLFLPGISEQSPLWLAAIQDFGAFARIFQGRATARRVADLSGGLDGFWANRSRKFRGNLRRDSREVAAVGPRFRYFREPMSRPRAGAFFQRLMRIEARGWKGRRGEGVNQGPMCDFYRRMLAVLGPRGQYRAVTVSIADREVGYILGGVLDSGYRGFQFSFDSDYSKLALGNLLQLHMIENLCAEGATRYDLGMEADYKRHWGELLIETTSLLVRR